MKKSTQQQAQPFSLLREHPRNRMMLVGLMIGLVWIGSWDARLGAAPAALLAQADPGLAPRSPLSTLPGWNQSLPGSTIFGPRLSAGESSPGPNLPRANSSRGGGAVTPLLGADSTMGLAMRGEAAARLDNRQKLAIGDTVLYSVLEDQEPARSLTLTDAGEVNVPELGLVAAAGKTCKQLAAEVKGRLEQTTYYQASVVVAIEQLNPNTVSGRKVFILGQVRSVGPLEIPVGQTWTVSRIITRAGGFTDYGDPKRVRLIRSRAPGKAGRSFEINVKDIWKTGKTEQDLPVEPDDIIYVPMRWF